MSNYLGKNDFRMTTLGSIFSLIGLSFSCLPSFAQTAIAPDTKLPVNTLVNFNNTNKIYTITGGTQVGTTQFHSFQNFSVPTGNTAHFDTLSNTVNAIARVTGSNISNIDGTLKTNGSTNLYLINPNGIIFGANAKLDIAGSFTASTANSMKFSDGTEFSATNPQAPPLLEVTIPLGLQYGKSNVGATITNSGSLAVGQDLVLNADKLDLQGRLQSGRDLTLQAQDSISIINGVLITSNTSVKGDAGNVNIVANTLELLGGSLITSTTLGLGNAGNITINVGDSIKFDGASSAESQVAKDAEGNAGGVNITAKTLELLGGSILASNTEGRGNAGNITINVGDSIKFDGESSAQSQVAEKAVGNAGNVSVSAKTLELLGGSFLATSTLGKGNAGNITIKAQDKIEASGIRSEVRSTVENRAVGNAGVVSIDTGSLAFTDGAQISTSTFGKGNAGNITITATDKVDLSGAPDTDINNSGVFSRVETGANGNAGTISVTANSLSVKDGARITARTAAQGNAGDVIIKVADAVLISGVQNDVPSRVSSSVNDGGVGDAGNVIIEAKSITISDRDVLVSSRTDGQGDAGNVNIKAETLNIQNGGSISTSTATNGNGGNINIILGEALFLDGNDSLITAGTTDTSTGRGGSILIDPPVVSITNGAEISVDSLGTGNGGNLKIVAGKFIFANNATLKANTASGEGGNINLQIADIFFPRNNSNITATAGGTGNGGNISISSLFMISVPSENNDIFANAFFGNGGDINITTDGLFGLRYRSSRTPLSDITASSEFGLQGIVSIATPGVDPSGGLTSLPTDTSDASRLVSEKCLADRQSSSFVITGRGGIPASPFGTISANNIPDRLGSISNQTASNAYNLVDSTAPKPSDRSSNNIPDRIPDRIVEAQGWIINDRGQISLIAEATATPAPVWSNQPKCVSISSKQLAVR